MSTFAGFRGATPATIDGTGTVARFFAPAGIAVGPDSTLGVVENACVRTITLAGVATTLSGNTSIGSANGQRAISTYNNPLGIAFNASGFAIIADTKNNVLRAVDPFGFVVTLSGNGTAGHRDGSSATCMFRSPSGIAIDPASGTLYVTDTGNVVLRGVSPVDGSASTFAGIVGVVGWVDGSASEAQFAAPLGIAIDPISRTLYVSDAFVIRQISASGSVTTLAGSGYAVYADSSPSGRTQASFLSPSGLALDAPNTRLIVADGNVIRAVALDGTGAVSTIAGNGAAGTATGLALATSFSDPSGVAVLGGLIYVADTGTQAVRRLVCLASQTSSPSVTPSATPTLGTVPTGSDSSSQTPSSTPSLITTPTASATPTAALSLGATSSVTPTRTASKSPVAGCRVVDFVGSFNSGTAALFDAAGTLARFASPASFALNTSASADVFAVADTGNHRLRYIDGNVVSTLAGSGAPMWGDGIGVAASFNAPRDVALWGGLWLVAGARTVRRSSGRHCPDKTFSLRLHFTPFPLGQTPLTTFCALCRRTVLSQQLRASPVYRGGSMEAHSKPSSQSRLGSPWALQVPSCTSQTGSTHLYVCIPRAS